MADIAALQERLKQIKEAVMAKLPDIAGVLAISAKALAERNIKENGFGANYSTNRIPVWFLEGKELNQSGLAFLQQKKKKDQQGTHQQDGIKYYPSDYGTNWREFRAAQGLPVANVDLSYTNMMWANMQPVQIEQRARIVRALLGGTNVETQNKMNWNRDRYGDFVQKGLRPEDRDTLQTVVTDEINSIIQQF
jgi:hypothetical protein